MVYQLGKSRPVQYQLITGAVAYWPAVATLMVTALSDLVLAWLVALLLAMASLAAIMPLSLKAAG